LNNSGLALMGWAFLFCAFGSPAKGTLRPKTANDWPSAKAHPGLFVAYIQG